MRTGRSGFGRRIGWVAGATLGACLVASCATNPVTGKTQLALMTEAEEIELGREADAEVLQSIGLYPDDALQAYVHQLGSRMAAMSERPHLPWTFRVVDDPSVNAFAIPGGFVYVTRGILAHMNSEAELVSVLGHEIGHITARHGVSQMSKQLAVGLGLGLAMILSEEVAQYGDLVAAGLGVLFLKYSRSDESQADHLGYSYLMAQGYDPRPMADMFSTLEQVSLAAEGEGWRLPAWLSTHPDPANRRRWVEQQVAAANEDLSARRVERAGYLRRLDGMVFGADPREGFVDQDNAFRHPGMAFRIDFPRGWAVENQKQAVGATSPEEDAQIVLELAAGDTPRAAAEEFFAQEGVVQGAPWRQRFGGMPAASYRFSAQIEDQEIEGLAAWVAHRGSIVQIVGYTVSESWRVHESTLAGVLSSFGRETDPEVLAAQPQRLRLEQLRRGGTFEEVAGRFEPVADPETLRLINHLGPGQRLEPGALFKRVVGPPSPR